MQLLTAKILFSVVFFANGIQAELSPDGQNVCLQTLTYEERIEVEVLKLVNEQKKKWCWKIHKSFRCDKLITSLKPVKEPRVVQRTKIVPKCCDGYEEEKGQGKNCLPKCSNGCRNGKCTAPGICACAPGFYGPECEKACPKNYWGNNCGNKCVCSENGNCDNVSGGCHCESGWRGKSCELPCQDGYYGHYCKEKCNCDGHCNHKTGECIIKTTETFIVTLSSLPTTTNELTEETSAEFHKQDAESISEAETTTIKEEHLLKATTFEEITSSTLDVEKIYYAEIATIKTTEESNENKEETKIINLKETSFSEDLEEVTEDTGGVSNTKGQIPVIEISGISNRTENFPVWTSFTDGENNFNKIETNDSISGRKKKISNNRKMSALFHFMPSFSVISGVSLLIFIIATKWVLSKRRKKARQKMAVAEKKENLFESEERVFSLVNNCTKNPVYLPEIDFNISTPILETFKPLTPDKGFISKEKEIK